MFVCYCLLLCRVINVLLLFVIVVTYLTAGAKKTTFADRTTFNVSNWQTKMLPVLSLLRKNKDDELAAGSLIDLVKKLQIELEQQDLCSLLPGAATQGETFLFDARDHHWGNMTEDLRFVVYSQAVSREVLGKWCIDKALQSIVLSSFYSAEYVVDRRTMASPAFLYHLWLYSSSDVLDIEPDKIADEASQLWETLSDLAELSLKKQPRGESWPSAVCQCCVRNDTVNLVQCSDAFCWMGAIHVDCIPSTGKARWKCKSCMKVQEAEELKAEKLKAEKQLKAKAEAEKAAEVVAKAKPTDPEPPLAPTIK